MPSLRDLQREFAVALHGGVPHLRDFVDDGIPAAARLAVYRNNASATFERALELTYPVVRRRVGDGYFSALARRYRVRHPSRAGDLHEVGREFAAFLARDLDGGPYGWLAELAELEWAVAEAAVEADSPVAGVDVLAHVPADALAGLRLVTVPSLRLVAASVPVLTVWRENRPGEAGAAVDLSTGPQHCAVHRAAGGVELRELPPSEHAFVEALRRGATLEEALDASALPIDDLAPAVHRLFDGGCIAACVPPDVAIPTETPR
jgi:hypothetical protein